VTSLRELLRELPYALLIPSVAACAAVCALLARYVVAAAASWLDDRWRAHRLAARRYVGDGLADRAVVTLRGTLAVDGEGATLRTRDTTVALEGSLDLRAHNRAVPIEALRGLRSDVIVRGVYRRRIEPAGAEAYRGASTQHAIVAEGGRIEVTRLRAAPPPRVALACVLVGVALGGLVGVAAPSQVLPRALARPPRVPRLRVRSIAYRHVVLERVAEERDRTCPLRLVTPARWGVERAECPPTRTLRAASDLDALIPHRLADPTPRATGRAIALAMGWPALAAELLVTPGDAASYRDAIRECFAGARHARVLELASEMPRAGYASVAAEVAASYLAMLTVASARDRDTARAVLAAAPDGASESLACIEAVGVMGEAVPSAQALALATRPGAPPACVILGATAHRGPEALRALTSLPPQSAIWQPVVDAARNFVLVEGIATGSVRAPAPSRFEAYGEPDALRESMPRAVASLLSSTCELIEVRGYTRLAWQVRLPALEALARSDFLMPPESGQESVRAEQASGVADHVVAEYQRALYEFDAASARDRRLNARALLQLRADLARFRAEAERRRAIRSLLWLERGEYLFDPNARAVVDAAFHHRPPSPDADYTFLAPIPVGRALAAVRARDPRALAEALGEPTTLSLAAARIVGAWQRPGDPRPCGTDSLVCAWVESALQDPRVAVRSWREGRVTQRAALERVAAEPSALRGVRQWPPGEHTGGAFVRAVMEALQRSLATGR